MASTTHPATPDKSNSQEELSTVSVANVPQHTASTSVDFSAVIADISRTKKPKSIRLEEHLLSDVEKLREQTNLNFNEYVEYALRHFNACLTEHLLAKEGRKKAV